MRIIAEVRATPEIALARARAIAALGDVAEVLEDARDHVMEGHEHNRWCAEDPGYTAEDCPGAERCDDAQVLYKIRALLAKLRGTKEADHA